MSHLFGCSILFIFVAIFMQLGVIQAGTASIAVDVACNTANGDTCDTGLVCENNFCKIKNGTACTVVSSCVDGAACTGTPKICVCPSWRTPVTPEGICAAKPTAGAAGGDCKTGTSCDAGLVCENAICRYKNNTACIDHNDLCVDGAQCVGSATKTCVCQIGRTPAIADGKCAAKPADGTAGGDCTTGQPCDQGLVCEHAICKYPNNTACTAHTDLCVDGALCVGSTPSICVCQVGRIPAAADGKCAAKVPVSGNCTGGKTCEDALVCEGNVCKLQHDSHCVSVSDKCVDGAACNTNLGLCKCGAGRTPATDGKCTENNGAASLLASSLLLIVGVFVTSPLL